METQLKKYYSLPVTPANLPFSDVYSLENCYFFLQTICGVLEANTANEVYFSLAGGRKSMSALMGVLIPFYRNIKGLYHILDRYEHDPKRKNYHTIEILTDYFINNEDLLFQKMFPPVENLKLVELPFEHFANADELKRILSKPDYSDEDLVSVKVDFEEESFYAKIFQPQLPLGWSEVRLSSNVKEQMESKRLKNSRRGDEFKKYFRMLQDNGFRERAGKDKGGKHAKLPGKDTIFYAAKLPRTAERPVWILKDNQVIICELGIENNRGEYIKVGTSTVLDEGYFAKKSFRDYPPDYSLADIASEEGVLIAGVGMSPMVVTQAYRLLKEHEGIKIKVVAMIYPEKNGDIKKGINYLGNAFEKEGFFRENIMKIGLKEYQDIDSKEACEAYLQKIIEVIDEIKRNHPEKTIHILLSGGRKGMAMLSLLAAQRSNIKYVYHTIILDEELEKELEEKGSIEVLSGKTKSPYICRTDKERVDRLLLKGYTMDRFLLFRLPVIPLRGIQ